MSESTKDSGPMTPAQEKLIDLAVKIEEDYKVPPELMDSFFDLCTTVVGELFKVSVKDYFRTPEVEKKIQEILFK